MVNRTLSVLLATHLVWILFVPAETPQAEPLAAIEAVLSLSSRDSLEEDVRRLVAFETRYIGSDSNAASAVWLKDQFEGMGYQSVKFDSFVVNVNRRVLGQTYVLDNVPQWNVVATKPGVLYSDRKLVIGAHYDSISLDRGPDEQDFAPGADDNASGVAGLLEIARILEGVDLETTVEFVLFGAEELGLIGSTHYASAAQANGEEILLMIQLDVISHQSAQFPNTFSIDTIHFNRLEGDLLAQAASEYTILQAFHSGVPGVQLTNLGCGCSDHQPFIDRGFPALGVFQYFQNPSEHINMSTDTLDKVDFALAHEITKAVLASVLQFAEFSVRTPDFDGDRRVDFTDFLLFATAFSVQSGDSKFDLNRDGTIAFSDFVLFAENYNRILD